MTEAEFLKKARDEYGSRGVRQAKEFIENHIVPIVANEQGYNKDNIQDVLFAAWLSAKKRAREKYTPIKYRR